ncbi:LrgB family protein [Anaeromyxobacter oryzisoli]|uniref:LrgB family protein n=1 Tax=Anaeromyxobacter oryzisoli TaxID=2925408 RepID=UPI001F591C80|nr:LrgB family protein [Anaeromyxobacter sp. SG63]
MRALAWLLATSALYAAARALYRRRPAVWLSPLLVVPAAVVMLLVVTGVPYAAYMAGGRWLVALLGPTTVAFAIPLHRNASLLRRHAVELAAGVGTGSAVAVVSSALLSRALGLGAVEAASMVPRSITTPFAMTVASALGGSPVLAAVFVIVTALVGIVVGRVLVRRLPLRSPLSRGALLGMGAHGAGTATALELGAVEGTVAGLVMIAAGLLLLAATPALRLALRGG